MSTIALTAHRRMSTYAGCALATARIRAQGPDHRPVRIEEATTALPPHAALKPAGVTSPPRTTARRGRSTDSRRKPHLEVQGLRPDDDTWRLRDNGQGRKRDPIAFRPHEWPSVVPIVTLRVTLNWGSHNALYETPPRFRPRLIRPGSPPVSPGRNRGGELERRAYRGRDPGCRRLPERHQPFSRGQGRAARSPRCPDRRRRSASLTPRRKQTPWTPSRGPVRPRRAPGPCAPRPRPFGQLRRRRATFVAQRSIDGPCTTTPGSAPDTSSP